MAKQLDRQAAAPALMFAVIAALAVACGGGDGPGDDRGDDADAAAAGDDPLSCEAFCANHDRCGDVDETCVNDCLRRPDIPSDVCEGAYAARNACVADLSCADLSDWLTHQNDPLPCAAEEGAIADACAS